MRITLYSPFFTGYNNNVETTKSVLAQNLITLRKAEKLTQAELAQILSYSDKSISKWENGDTIPDLDTLIALSNFYNITLDQLCKTLITDEQACKDQIKASRRRRMFTRNKIIITILSMLLVWFAAIFIYVQLKLIYDYNYWMIFIWALPLSCLVLTVFCSIWAHRRSIAVAVSALVWSILLALHINFVAMGFHDFWLIYFLGIPAQIAIVLSIKLDFKTNK